MVYLKELMYLKTGVVPKVTASLRGFLSWAPGLVTVLYRYTSVYRLYKEYMIVHETYYRDSELSKSGAYPEKLQGLFGGDRFQHPPLSARKYEQLRL